MNAGGWSFAGWSGGASGNANTTVTMNGHLAVTATFIQNHVYFDDLLCWQGARLLGITLVLQFW